jgi:hypothetical protein
MLCRFLISPAYGAYSQKDSFQISLPSLVATLQVAQRSPDATVAQLHVELHKLVTAATLFGAIASTPLYPSPSCQRVFTRIGNDAAGESSLPPNIEYFGPVLELTSLQGDQDGFLLGDSTIHPKWVTNTRLAKGAYVMLKGTDWNQSLDTIFEVLKLAGRQCDSIRTLELEGTRNEAQDIYLDLEVTLQEYNIFAERVSYHISASCLCCCFNRLFF